VARVLPLVGDEVVIAAVGPEAEHDPKGFRRACGHASERLDERQR
jgi:hypothetical protein